MIILLFSNLIFDKNVWKIYIKFELKLIELLKFF